MFPVASRSRTIPLHVRIPADARWGLEAMAKERSTTVSHVVNTLLEAAMKAKQAACRQHTQSTGTCGHCGHRTPNIYDF